MVKILFVCYGNICRSPMAQAVMADLVAQTGLQAKIAVDSAATSTEEIGHGPHHGTRRVLAAHGVPCVEHRARQLTRADYAEYDLLIGMESRNVRDMVRMLGGDPQHKVRRLLDFTNAAGDIDDPWYTGDFESTYRDVTRGCTALLRAVERLDD